MENCSLESLCESLKVHKMKDSNLYLFQWSLVHLSLPEKMQKFALVVMAMEARS